MNNASPQSDHTPRTRANSSKIQFRRVIPVDLRPHYGGRTEITRSTGESDPDRAKDKINDYWRESDEEFAQVRADLARAQLDEAAVAWLTPLVEERVQAVIDVALRSGSATPSRYFAEWAETSSTFLDALVREHRYRPDPQNECYLCLREALARATGRALALTSPSPSTLSPAVNIAAVAVPPVAGMPVPAVVAPPPVVVLAEGRGGATQPDAPGAKVAAHVEPPPTFADLFTNWKAVLADNNPKTARCYEQALEELLAWLEEEGHPHVFATDLTRTLFRAFRNHLKASGAAQNTMIRKVACIKTLYTVAVEEGFLEESPCAQTKVRKSKNPKTRRRSFYPEELLKLFGDPLFTEGRLPRQRRRGGKEADELLANAGGPAAYWLVLLLHYTGARLEEMAQLMVADFQIVMISGQRIVYLRVRNYEEEQDTKNAESNRDVPLHHELLRLGFEDYVRSLPPDGRMFPLLTPDVYGILSSGFSKWFGSFKRRLGIASRNAVLHSFRHNFRDACRQAGVRIDAAYALDGHTLGGVGEDYGSLGLPLSRLTDDMQSLVFPGMPTLHRVTLH